MQITEVHKKEFGCVPQAVASAPDRFHLIGEHSWFFKDKTLSLAIDVPVTVSVSGRDDDFFYYYWLEKDDRKKSGAIPAKVRKEDRWVSVIKSVIYGFVSKGANVQGLNLVLSARMSPVFGYGRTNAIKFAVAYAINAALGFNFTEDELVSIVVSGSRDFLKERIFLADLYSAVYSEKDSFILTDYANDTFEILPFDFSDKSLLFIETKVPRFDSWHEASLFEPEYALLMGDLKEEKKSAVGGWVYNDNLADIHEILAACGEKNIRKLIALIREHKNVLEARDGILSGQFGSFARAVNSSHESMRDYYEMSSPEVDWILKRILSINPNLADVRNPFSCGRICDTPSFRCMYSFVPDENIPELEKKFQEFERIFGFRVKYEKIVSRGGVEIVS